MSITNTLNSKFSGYSLPYTAPGIDFISTEEYNRTMSVTVDGLSLAIVVARVHGVVHALTHSLGG